jgi:hypothetical protein
VNRALPAYVVAEKVESYSTPERKLAVIDFFLSRDIVKLVGAFVETIV